MKSAKATRAERGDTLIEVLFAFAVLSLVVIGALSIMNAGTIASQRSLETTLVRQQIDGQATTLRFLHDAYVAHFKPGVTAASLGTATPAGQWAAMSSKITTTSASSLANLTSCPATYPTGSFILNPKTATFQGLGINLGKSVTYSQLLFTGTPATTLSSAQGIWIEAVRSGNPGNASQNNTRYIDFHINACWDAPGNGPPMTIATIVRLYEPQS